MWEVIKCFAFFGLGLMMSEIYHLLAWRRYPEGRNEAARRSDVELHGRRYTT